MAGNTSIGSLRGTSADGQPALDEAGRRAAPTTRPASSALVARQEATLGIVYQTDANAEPKVKILDTFPEESHPEIVYFAAGTAESTRSGAGLEFITYLKAGPAQAHFAKQGFKAAK